MKLDGEKVLLRVYLRNTDQQSWFSPPAALAIVGRAHAEGLAGVIVLQGELGLDIRGKLLESSAWSLVEHAPIIVQVVDEGQKIGRFLTTLAELLPEALVTLERAHVLLYRHQAPAGERAAVSGDLPAAVAPLSTLPSAEEFALMKLSANGQLLRVFIGDSDAWEGQPLYRAIVLKARELGLAGATVLRGPMGFGANSRVHTAKLLDLSTDLPVVIELVDLAEKIRTILPFLDEAVAEGMITMEEVKVLRYRHGTAKTARSAPS